MNNNKDRERENIWEEIKDLHPALRENLGRKGRFVSQSKLSQFRLPELSAHNHPGIFRLNRSVFRKIAAALLLLLIGAASVFISNEGRQNQFVQDELDFLAVMDYLIEEADQMEDEFIMSQMGSEYLETLDYPAPAEGDFLHHDFYYDTYSEELLN